MSISRYIKAEDLENVAESLIKDLVIPALERLVADSSNPYDDAALSIAKPMLLSLADKIDGEVG